MVYIESDFDLENGITLPCNEIDIEKALDKAENPKGIILMGKSNDLTAKQLLDLEIIRKMYSNIVDIYTYSDIITMLENILYQIKIKVNNSEVNI